LDVGQKYRSQSSQCRGAGTDCLQSLPSSLSFYCIGRYRIPGRSSSPGRPQRPPFNNSPRATTRSLPLPRNKPH
jgi:hypothetical protein